MTQSDALSPARMRMPRPEDILTALAIALAALAVLFVLAFAWQNQTQAQVLRRIELTRPARLQSARLAQALTDVEAGQRRFLLTNDAASLDAYESGRAGVRRELSGLRATAARQPALAAPVASAESSALVALASIESTLSRQRASPMPREQIVRELLASQTSMDAARRAAQNVAQSVERIIDVSRAQDATSRSAIYTLGALLGLLAIAAVFVAAWALRQERRAWRATFTALSEAHEAAELARAKAAASDLAKTRFLATASHDMRQPLHALTLYLSALDRRVQAPEAREILKKMENAAESLVAMFATLLDLARIQADVVEPEITDFPIQNLIDRLVSEHPGADVVAEFAAPSLIARTDVLLLERLLRNLISNGLKHGGAPVRVVAAPVQGQLQISVSDRGPGIAPEDQARIFEEFVRLEGKPGNEGLGLGLAIVKRIADLLNLKLTLESTPPNGATFSVLTPVGAAAPARAAEPPSATQLNGERILLLDDDPNALEALSAVVRDLGAQVASCASEAAARETLHQGFRPHLLVVDLRIDGKLRGVEIAGKLRALTSPTPAVLIVTGDTAADTLAFLSASGFQWLIKPVEPAALKQAIVRQVRAAEAMT
ncbi:MAG: response regulator [Proteobacteria bacterium]|nr:response regulator [Pseudomonadota bacterium]